jgi:hypothetical protein
MIRVPQGNQTCPERSRRIVAGLADVLAVEDVGPELAADVEAVLEGVASARWPTPKAPSRSMVGV